ncbi:hypothetical protein BGZ99_002942 [Dissophora globulifera]|uniref:Uncharacterized protein n=1 Tax=Dissophora globulifera TaxID=979702 RepID=A0A9P6RQS5_9FUNG|nr:hypothetical protein BGZ99_002942 [Dissophora globulifera]
MLFCFLISIEQQKSKDLNISVHAPAIQGETTSAEQRQGPDATQDGRQAATREPPKPIKSIGDIESSFPALCGKDADLEQYLQQRNKYSQYLDGFYNGRGRFKSYK